MLPRLYVILDRDAARRGCGDLLDAAHAAADAGARFFQIRDKQLPPDKFYAHAEAVTLRLAGYDPVILVNDRADVALSLGLAGVHRPQNGLPTDELRRLLEYRVVGASCHDAAEAEDAAGLGADFVTVSPVFETSSKPGAPLLGLAGLAKIAGPLDVPVYALGGVTPQRVGACLDRGAHGVAVLAGIMAAEDPYRATERYIEALAAHLN